MKKIEFVNSQVGFFSNGTEVFLTVNGGKDISKLFNWSTYSEAEDDYYNFHFFDQLTGFRNEFGWGSYNSVKGYQNGTSNLKYTQDGGLNWSSVNVPSFSNGSNNLYFASYHFLNPNVGFAIGRMRDNVTNNHTSDGLYKTIDKGISWSLVYTNIDINKWPISFYFLDNNTGWIFGKNILLKTTDAGANWVSNSSNIVQYDLKIKEIKFVSNLIGYAVTENSESRLKKLYKTIDGGSVWNEISTQSKRINSLFILNQNNIWFSFIDEPLYLYYTSNDFQSFIKSEQPLTYIKIVNHRSPCGI